MNNIPDFIWILNGGEIDLCGQIFNYSLIEVNHFDNTNCEISLVKSEFENYCVNWTSPNQLNELKKK